MELYWGAVLFFQDIFTPRQEAERKSQLFSAVNDFHCNFKLEWENGVWTKVLLIDCDFLFSCGNLNSIFANVLYFLLAFFFYLVFPFHLLSMLGLGFCLVEKNFWSVSWFDLLFFVFMPVLTSFCFHSCVKNFSIFMPESKNDCVSFTLIINYMKRWTKQGQVCLTILIFKNINYERSNYIGENKQFDTSLV